jgi:thiol-disulfide isomerase/thioredoxin
VLRSFAMRAARTVPFLIALSVVACSRHEDPPSLATNRVDPSSEPALGPRVDPSAETAQPAPVPVPVPVPAPSVDPSAEPAEPALGPRADLASALSVVAGEALLARIRASKNKGVVVTAFASWCDPCREELPLLNAAAPKIASRGVPIWVVSMDEPDAVPAAKALLDSLHIGLPAFAAAPPLEAFKQAINPRWPGMIPASFLFDASGKLRYFWAGEVYEKELVPVVEGFLAGKHIDGTSDFGNSPGATRPGHEQATK